MASTKEKLRCISCKNEITNTDGSVEFPCPKCGETNIVRCGKCRTTCAPYKCLKCEFEGP